MDTLNAKPTTEPETTVWDKWLTGKVNEETQELSSALLKSECWVDVTEVDDGDGKWTLVQWPCPSIDFPQLLFFFSRVSSIPVLFCKWEFSSFVKFHLFHKLTYFKSHWGSFHSHGRWSSTGWWWCNYIYPSFARNAWQVGEGDVAAIYSLDRILRTTKHMFPFLQIPFRTQTHIETLWLTEWYVLQGVGVNDVVLTNWVTHGNAQAHGQRHGRIGGERYR